MRFRVQGLGFRVRVHRQIAQGTARPGAFENAQAVVRGTVSVSRSIPTRMGRPEDEMRCDLDDRRWDAMGVHLCSVRPGRLNGIGMDWIRQQLVR